MKLLHKMAVRRRGMRRRMGGRKKRGKKSVTKQILGGIKSYKKITSALGVRKGLASLGKLGINTGLRMARSRASMMV